jgi:hypothetical protein
MQKSLIILFVCLLVSSCNSGSSDYNHKAYSDPHNDLSVTSASDTANFKVAFDKLFYALQQADTTLFNQFIHPEHGLWVIEQPGALPKMTHITKIQKFKREYQDRSFFTIAQDVQKCDLTEGPFPKFDCGDMNYDLGKTGYSKDGCFVGKADKFKSSGYWNYASLPDNKIQQIKNTLPLVNRSVLHTQSSYEFHFGYTNKQWHLLFAKIIYPCSA